MKGQRAATRGELQDDAGTEGNCWILAFRCYFDGVAHLRASMVSQSRSPGRPPRARCGGGGRLHGALRPGRTVGRLCVRQQDAALRSRALQGRLHARHGGVRLAQGRAEHGTAAQTVKRSLRIGKSVTKSNLVSYLLTYLLKDWLGSAPK